MSQTFDSRLQEAARKRRQRRTLKGYADPTFCPSCAKPRGAALVGTPSVYVLCEDCLKHPLPAVCATCNVLAPSTVRQPRPGEVWICDECCERASNQPPPGMAWTEEKEG